MSKRIFFIIFALLSSRAFCDVSVLHSYMQNFSTSDLITKTEILRSVKNDRMMNEHIGIFYEYALSYVLDNYAQIGESVYVNNIINISLDGLVTSGRRESLEPQPNPEGEGSPLDVMWRLFSIYPDSKTRAELLIAMGILGKGNRTITRNINNYLMEKTQTFRSGSSVDYSIISACITAIMELNDSSSYPVLFACICAGYPEVIYSEAYGAFELIHGSQFQFLSGVIENRPPIEKFAAFRTGINSTSLALSERGQLAELALVMSIEENGENIDMTEMRYAAVAVLTSYRWTRANASAIRHYYRVQTDYQNDAAFKERFIEAIAFLGAVGNSQAALILCLQLGLINARMESSSLFDAEITMAIVQALGLIGDNAAFDHLLTVKNLSYPENIKAAAQEAIERLKW